MLRLTLSAEEYIQIDENIKIIFLGGSKNHLRIMVDAPKEVNIARGKAIESRIEDEEERKKLPRYFEEPKTKEEKQELKKRLKEKKGMSIVLNK